MELETIAVVGPTASGKTRRAVEIAKAFNGEIISADSRQLYRGMTIGTGKDLDEYGDVPYHLIDVADAGERWNLHRYLRSFRQSFGDIKGRGRLPVVCGGTGMYVEHALNGVVLPEVPINQQLRDELSDKPLDELERILSTYRKLHNTTDTDTAKRAIRAIEIADYYSCHPEEAAMADKENSRPLDAIVIGIDIPRGKRRERISERLDARIEEGMIGEIEMLLAGGLLPEDLIYYGLEYKFVTLYVIGKMSLQEMKEGLETAIHQFAKRQMTWFRGMEKRGIHINWLPYDLPQPEFIGQVKRLVEDREN